jgi:hypothetical protein
MAAKKDNGGPRRVAHIAHHKRDPDWSEAFCAALACSPNVSAAAEAAGVARRTV